MINIRGIHKLVTTGLEGSILSRWLGSHSSTSETSETATQRNFLAITHQTYTIVQAKGLDQDEAGFHAGIRNGHLCSKTVCVCLKSQIP